MREKRVILDRILTLALVGVATIVMTLLSVGQHSVFAQASNTTTYSDPSGRFSISYPKNWTAEPATNRFVGPLVKFTSGVGPGAFIDMLPQASDPEVVGRVLANSGLAGYTLFQDVECTKYKVDGKEACSIIFSKQADINLGTPGAVVMTVASYVNGHMYSFGFGAPPDKFDSVLPTFEAMLNSFKAGK